MSGWSGFLQTRGTIRGLVCHWLVTLPFILFVEARLVALELDPISPSISHPRHTYAAQTLSPPSSAPRSPFPNPQPPANSDDPRHSPAPSSPSRHCLPLLHHLHRLDSHHARRPNQHWQPGGRRRCGAAAVVFTGAAAVRLLAVAQTLARAAARWLPPPGPTAWSDETGLDGRGAAVPWVPSSPRICVAAARGGEPLLHGSATELVKALHCIQEGGLGDAGEVFGAPQEVFGFDLAASLLVKAVAERDQKIRGGQLPYQKTVMCMKKAAKSENQADQVINYCCKCTRRSALNNRSGLMSSGVRVRAYAAPIGEENRACSMG